MRKINLAITGCMGRMGQQILRSANSDKDFNISALTESRVVNKKINQIITVKIISSDNKGLIVRPEECEMDFVIKKNQIAINTADARPSRFTGGERIDCAIAELDLNKRKVALSIKLLEEIEKKEYRDEVKSSYGIKRYKIQEVIKPGQVVLIQVIKEERGQKGAALTTFISLAGKYMVLMPNTPKGGGISRKIFNSGERKKIRSILNEITIPKEMGLIVRTAGSNKSKNEINYDLQSLIKSWETIKENAMSSIAPKLIHQESDIIKRSIRDMYDDDTQNIIVEGNEGYQKAKNYMKLMMPKHLKKVKKYRDKLPLFFKEKFS